MADSRANQPQPTAGAAVAMRDGTRLATDIYLPDEWTSGPTILARTSYGKTDREELLPWVARYFTARGYAFVAQDVRGRGQSEGQIFAFLHEVDDAYDTLDWISQQPWSNARVGMFGYSYGAYLQWAAVASRHPALIAISPMQGTPGEPHLAAESAAPDVEPPVSVHAVSSTFHYFTDNDDHDVDVDWLVRPAIDAVEKASEAIGRRSPSVDMMVPNFVPIPLFPQGHPFTAAPIPVLTTLGWFDPFAQIGIGDYQQLRSLPGWKDSVHLLIDSVDHLSYHLDHAPVAEGADHARDDSVLTDFLPRYAGPTADFYDRVLRDEPTSPPLPPITWHLGHVGFQESERWPPEGTVEMSLALTDLSHAMTGPAGGTLGERPTAAEEVRWLHDPKHPVRSVVPELFAPLREYPDEWAGGNLRDAVRFTSEPVAAPWDLAGPVTVSASITSAAPAVDVFARLLDVCPDGFARLILRGEMTVPISAEEETAFDLYLGDIGYRLRIGHRLCLQIASSDFPDFLPSAGVAGNPWLVRESIAREVVLRSSPEEPAVLTVTLLASDAPDSDRQTVPR